MICPSCERDIQPLGLSTGFQEIAACRIHLARDHGIRKSTMAMLELRNEMEGEQIPGDGCIIYIDTDREEQWLA